MTKLDSGFTAMRLLRKLKRVSGDTCRCVPIDLEVFDLELSMQASRFHYCEPRIDILDPREYETYEIAFLNSQGIFVPPIMKETGLFDCDTVLGWQTPEQIAYLCNIVIGVVDKFDEDYYDSLG
jgi:hypothetical protein